MRLKTLLAPVTIITLYSAMLAFAEQPHRNLKADLARLEKEQQALGTIASDDIISDAKYRELAIEIDQVEEAMALQTEAVKPSKRKRDNAPSIVVNSNDSLSTTDPAIYVKPLAPTRPAPGGDAWVMVALLMSLAAYFIPGLIAWRRQKRNATAICALNLFLGWTVLGWVVALVWALAFEAPLSDSGSLLAAEGRSGNLSLIARD